MINNKNDEAKEKITKEKITKEKMAKEKTAKEKLTEEKLTKDHRKLNRHSAILLTLIVLILIAGGSIFIYFNAGHNPASQVIEFADDEVMRVNDQKVVMNEFLLYAADVYQGYNLQNEADWDSVITDSEDNPTTFEEQVKGTICEQIRMTKVLCRKAQDEGITLSSDEKQILAENAQTYYTDLTSANVIDEALTVELIARFYEENALAQKVYNNIMNSYDEKQDSPTLEDYDTEGTDVSEKELYFIDVYNDLAEKYDKNYDYYTSINWNLLDQLSFSDISKDDTTEADTAENTAENTQENTTESTTDNTSENIKDNATDNTSN